MNPNNGMVPTHPNLTQQGAYPQSPQENEQAHQESDTEIDVEDQQEQPGDYYEEQSGFHNGQNGGHYVHKACNTRKFY